MIHRQLPVHCLPVTQRHRGSGQRRHPGASLLPASARQRRLHCPVCLVVPSSSRAPQQQRAKAHHVVVDGVLVALRRGAPGAAVGRGALVHGLRHLRGVRDQVVGLRAACGQGDNQWCTGSILRLGARPRAWHHAKRAARHTHTHSKAARAVTLPDDAGTADAYLRRIAS